MAKTAPSQTEIDSSVSGVWTVENSPYIVLEGANIPQDEVLTIQAGVELIIRYRLMVHGAIHAEGSEEDSVFICNDPDAEGIGGSLLRYDDHSGEGSVFNYTNLISTTCRLIYIAGDCGDLELTFNHSRLSGTSGIRNDLGSVESIRISNCLLVPTELGGYLLQMRSVRSVEMENNDVLWSRIDLTGGLEFILIDNNYTSSPRINLTSVRNLTIAGNRTEPPQENQAEADSVFNKIGTNRDLPRRDPSGGERVLFVDNSLIGNWSFGGIGDGSECIAEDNVIYGTMGFGGFDVARISDCTVEGNISCNGDGDEESCIIENNALIDTHSRFISISGENFTPIVRNNIGENAYLAVWRQSTPEVYNNTFGLGATVTGGNPNIHHNILGTKQDNQTIRSIMYNEAAGGAFTNNVILSWGYNGRAVEIRDESRPLITSNIFYHNWDVSATAIRCFDEPRATIRYNIFYQFEENFRDIEAEDNNIFEDPLFAHVNPFDFRLQPHSPAIDAGDPDLPEDPDGTRCDIGLIFFDQRCNNRPCITSPANILIGYGDTLIYTATASDDSEELFFRFENLPEWLGEWEHRDFVIDSVVVSGIVPEEEQSFAFIVFCEDEEGEEDSLVVNVEVSNYTLLKDNLSGTLSAEDSPFWIPEPAWVESGDSLIIEPGCVIFLNDDDWDAPRPRPRLYIYGYLGCIGSAEDSIYFIGYNEVLGGKMPRFYSSTDTSEIAFTQCHGGLNGAPIRSHGGRIIVHNCLFLPDMLREIQSHDTSWTKAIDNVFFNRSIGGGRNSDIELINNIVFCDSSIERRPLSRYLDCNTISKGNLYRNCDMAYYIYDGGTLISRNDVFLNCAGGFSLDAENAVVENCFLSKTDRPFLRLYNGRITVRNSIILSDSNRILGDIGEEVVLTLENNSFLRSDTLVGEILEGFGILSEANDNWDSTDAYGNLFGEPGLINIYPLEYRLGRNSRCINAALTEDDERDPDGTPPDIGPIPFNHNNHPIEITGSHVVPDLRIYAREEIRCGVEIVDQDDDPTAFQWDLYRLIVQPDDEPPVRIFLRTIGRSADIVFSVDTTGNYLIRCIATDGYDLDTLYREIFALPSSVEDDYVVSPTEFHLYQNYPNPFNSSTMISFGLPDRTHVKLEIYNLQGRMVIELTDREYSAGYHHLIWKATNLPSGIYICRFQSPVKTGNILITKLK